MGLVVVFYPPEVSWMWIKRAKVPLQVFAMALPVAEMALRKREMPLSGGEMALGKVPMALRGAEAGHWIFAMALRAGEVAFAVFPMALRGAETVCGKPGVGAGSGGGREGKADGARGISLPHPLRVPRPVHPRVCWWRIG
jgi:hypothetical protein